MACPGQTHGNAYCFVFACSYKQLSVNKKANVCFCFFIEAKSYIRLIDGLFPCKPYHIFEIQSEPFWNLFSVSYILFLVCIIHRIKPEEFYILSCEKYRRRRPRPFTQLRM